MNKSIEKSHINYIDFHSYQALEENKFWLDELVKLYKAIFAESGVWNEHYSDHEIKAKLKIELSNECHLRLCYEQSDKKTLIGFCWAQVIQKNEMIKSFGLIDYFNENAPHDLQQSIVQQLENESIVYVHDLGVKSSRRGKVSLKKLIAPTVCSLITDEADQVCFWSVEDTCIARLANNVDIQLVLAMGKFQFFKGHIKDTSICSV